MKFFKPFSENQIKALIKKDILIRIRQPWMTIIQFIWPCIIFISLYSLRHRFQPKHIPNCQFPTRQLPSKHNLLPFYHSYICTIENKCEDTDKYEEISRFEEAPLKPILNIAQIFINDDSLYQSVVDLPNKANWVTLVTTLATNSKFQEIQDNIMKVVASMPQVNTMIEGNFDIKKAFSDDLTFSKFGSIICGKPFPRSDNIRFVNDILDTDDLSKINDDELDAMPTAYCKKLYLDISSSNRGKLTWSQVKPVIQGKLIYGPNNDETSSIVKFANTSFEEMNRLQNLAGALDLAITKLHNNKTFADSFMHLLDLAKSPFIKMLIGDSFDVDQLESMMFRFKTDETVADIFRTVNNILECFSVDRFVPVTNEKQLREKAFELNKKRLYYAGIYFNETSKNVGYKILVDTENTPITLEMRNRFWFPGPEGSMVENLRYHRGFVQIQHSIDVGIIKHKKSLAFAKKEDVPIKKNDDDFFADFANGNDKNKDEKKVENNSTLVENNSTLVENNSTLVENNSTLVENNSTLVSERIPNIVSGLSSKTPNDDVEFDEDLDFDDDFDLPIDKNDKERKKRSPQSGFFDLLSNFGSDSKKTENKFLVDDIKVFTKQFPYPEYTKDDFKKGIYLAQSVQMAFFMGFIIQIASCVRYRIWMRESKNTMMMRTMGLQSSSEILAWIVTTLVEIIIVFIIASSILYSGQLLHFTGVIFISIFLFIFGLCMISFCYMCSTIFTSATIGSVSSSILFLMTFLPYIVIICLDTSLSSFTKFITNLSFSTAFCYAFDNIMRQEMQEFGLTFNEVFSSGLDSEFFYSICMIILDMILYAIIGYSVERIRNDEYKFNRVETDVLNANIGATFRNVSKIYDDNKIAVSNISLDFPKEQITCLLGRNGAGKSTILKMLTGQITPTTGRVFMARTSNNRNETERIGLCTQDNILIPFLTAKEHLELYARIKIKKNFENEVDKTMQNLNFGKYENFEAYKLSGGYQRRLCVAIAFIGSPNVVILDEPCSSIDTKARKFVWELVEQLRIGRAVILATHFLDEAEYFSDSVVILNNGKIISKHNPQTLKTLFTKSFQLTIQLNAKNFTVSETIKNLFEKYLKTFKPIQYSDNELKISVSYDPTVNDCSTLINELENLQDEKKIKQISITSKNLETVFNNINKGIENMSSNGLPKVDDLKNDRNDLMGYNFRNELNRFDVIRYLFWKRFLNLSRNFKLLTCILLLPVIFEAIAMSFMQLRPGGEYDRVLNLSRNLYPETTEFFSLENPNDFTNTTMEYLKHPHCNKQMSDCHEFSNSEKAFVWVLETDNNYHEQRYGGVTINESNVNVWYNNKGYHSMVSWLNDLNTNMFKAEMNDTSYQISTYNSPLKLGDHELSTSSILQQVSDAGISLILLIAFSLVVAATSVFIVNERVSGEKLQQKLCGVDFQTYWGVAFTWDFLVVLIALVECVILLKIYNIPIYNEKSNLNGICLMIVLYGFATISSVHLFEKIFSEASFANMALFCCNVIIALTTLTIIVLFDILGESDTAAWWRNFLNRAFLIFPQHALADGLIEICKNYIMSEVFIRFDIDTYKSPVTSNLLLPHYVALTVMGLLFLILNYIIESDCDMSQFKRICSPLIKLSKREDPVELKIVSIQNSLNRNETTGYESETFTLKVENLSKSYSKGDYAVNDVSFEVKNGECFGLLGKNGAGKSTIFKILCRQINQDSGNFIYSNKEISYCPQTIALDPLLTVKEILEFYGNLRRITDTKKMIKKVLKSFDLTNYENILVKNLSGGNRRKLNVAVSCLGSSNIILMDEPTSDMDPVTRCLVYKAINELLASNKSVLLTSHAISEIDQICQRIGILNKGKLINCSTLNELNEEFGGYYNTTIFFQNTEASTVLRDIQNILPHIENVQVHPHSIKFMVKIKRKTVIENGKNINKSQNNNDGNNGSGSSDNDKINGGISLSSLFDNLNRFSNINKIQFSINRCRMEVIFEKILDANNDDDDVLPNNANDKLTIDLKEDTEGGYTHKGFVENEMENHKDS